MRSGQHLVSAKAVAGSVIFLAVAAVPRAVLRLRTAAVSVVGLLARPALLAVITTGLLRLQILAVEGAAVCVGTLLLLVMAVLAVPVLS
jgi:hypothetical protein